MNPADEAKIFLNKRRLDLLDRLGAIESRRASAAAPAPERDPEFESGEVLERLFDVTHAELLQVQHAIDRAESGHYGICERCGAWISPARLSVVPDATCCSGCSNKQAA